MIKFNEKEKRDNVNGALALRSDINRIVDSLWEKKIKNICWLGIGGTYASALQVVVHMKEMSELNCFAENAAEFNVTGNKQIGKGTIVIISSVTGTTQEIVEAVNNMHKAGAEVIGFIDEKNSVLAETVDYLICYKGQEQLKFYMVADRFMYNNKEFDLYAQFYKQLEEYLAEGLINVEKQADKFAQEFAEKHHDDSIHYYVGSGNQWGEVYSYGMCYMEEMHWLRTKTITSADFFHGTLEVIERDTPVTVFIGEDSQRALSERVKNFLPRICANYTVIDSKDYAMEGIDSKFRGMISFMITHAVTNRIDAHMEKINCHPMEIRRYYRCLDY